MSISAISKIKKESRHAHVRPSKQPPRGQIKGRLTSVGWVSPEEDDEEEELRVLKGDIIHTPEQCTNLHNE